MNHLSHPAHPWMEQPVGKGTKRGWDGDRCHSEVSPPLHEPQSRALPSHPSPAPGMLPRESGSGGTWDSQNCSPKQGEPKRRGKGHLKTLPAAVSSCLYLLHPQGRLIIPDYLFVRIKYKCLWNCLFSGESARRLWQIQSVTVKPDKAPLQLCQDPVGL